jgi:hypothetical protein
MTRAEPVSSGFLMNHQLSVEVVELLYYKFGTVGLGCARLSGWYSPRPHGQDHEPSHACASSDRDVYEYAD